MPSKKTETRIEYQRLNLLETSAVGIPAYPNATYGMKVQDYDTNDLIRSLNKIKGEVELSMSSKEDDLNKEVEGIEREQQFDAAIKKLTESQTQVMGAVNAVTDTVKALAGKVEEIDKQRKAEVDLLAKAREELDKATPGNQGLGSGKEAFEKAVVEFQKNISDIKKDATLTPQDRYHKVVEIVGAEVGEFMRALALEVKR